MSLKKIAVRVSLTILIFPVGHLSKFKRLVAKKKRTFESENVTFLSLNILASIGPSIQAAPLQKRNIWSKDIAYVHSSYRSKFMNVGAERIYRERQRDHQRKPDIGRQRHGQTDWIKDEDIDRDRNRNGYTLRDWERERERSIYT